MDRLVGGWVDGRTIGSSTSWGAPEAPRAARGCKGTARWMASGFGVQPFCGVRVAQDRAHKCPASACPCVPLSVRPSFPGVRAAPSAAGRRSADQPGRSRSAADRSAPERSHSGAASAAAFPRAEQRRRSRPRCTAPRCTSPRQDARAGPPRHLPYQVSEPQTHSRHLTYRPTTAAAAAARAAGNSGQRGRAEKSPAGRSLARNPSRDGPARLSAGRTSPR